MKAALPKGMHFERFMDLGADMSFTEGNKGIAVDFVLNYLKLWFLTFYYAVLAL